MEHVISAPRRHHRVKWAMALVAATIVLQLLMVAFAAASDLGASALVTVSVVVQLPFVLAAGTWAARHHQNWRALTARLDLAEHALGRAQERVHELRATVGSLRLSHQLLIDRRASLSRTARWHLQDLHAAELARMERLLAVEPRGEITTVDLADVLEPLVDVMAVQGCTVRWRRTSSPVCGRIDDLTEIIHVLLDNAAKHAPGRDVRLELATLGGWTELKVRDGGLGVPRAIGAAVFERGARGPGSQGEGIGLHVARRLARQLGGDLRLVSQQTGGGATFVLRLREATESMRCLAVAG